MSDEVSKRESSSADENEGNNTDREPFQEEPEVEVPADESADADPEDGIDAAETSAELEEGLNQGESTVIGEPAANPILDEEPRDVEPEAEEPTGILEEEPADIELPASASDQPSEGDGDSPADEAEFVTVDRSDQTEVTSDPTATVTGAALSPRMSGFGAGWDKKAGSLLGRFVGPVEDALKPAQGLVASTSQRVIIGLALLIALISLLADSSGFALLVLGMVGPLIMVLVIMRQDVFETESPLMLLGIGAVGLVVGLLLGWIGAWVVREQWIDIGTLNFGAAGYGGIYADAEGNANVLIWLVNGLLLPLISLAAIIAGPIALRRYAQFRNEIMDGAVLGVIGAAGFAIGSLIIFLSPGVTDGLPRTSVSDWTLTTLAVIVTRPLILTLGGAMLGIAIWRYMRDGNVYGLILPAVGSVGAWLLLALGTVQLQPAGLSVEFLWNLLLAIGVFVLYRRIVAEAIVVDTATLGTDGGRIVCPHCRKMTPVGTFCASCGESLANA